MTEELGLVRGTVALTPHREYWEENARETIALLRSVFEDAAVDIRHVGSTAVRSISAKPIIDIAVGVRELDDVEPLIPKLSRVGVIFRGSDIEGQLLFVIGDFEKDTRTHHIHVVAHGGRAWNDYLNFVDYLGSHAEKAREYEALKLELAKLYANDRNAYTAGKAELVARLLAEAQEWRERT